MFSTGSKNGSGMFSIGENSGATPTPFDKGSPDLDVNEGPRFGGLELNPIHHMQSIRQAQAMGVSGLEMSDSDEDEKPAAD